jgi:hypothetical protein
MNVLALWLLLVCAATTTWYQPSRGTLYDPSNGNDGKDDDGTALGKTSPHFDGPLAKTALYLSQAAYCDPGPSSSCFDKHGNNDVLAGFEFVATIFDAEHDTHGYIGHSESEATIFVAFRGSESIANWVSNIDTALMDYPYCDGCKVHEGFYAAEQAVIADVLRVVAELKAAHPSYGVVVTGHSLGAALATYCVFDLQQLGVANVKMINFGSPRVGNTAFAAWCTDATKNTDKGSNNGVLRVTHRKDIVAHTPTKSERFEHIAGEWYEPDDHTDPVHVVFCHGKEDAACSAQWWLPDIADHMWYLGLPMGTTGDACDAFL